MNRTLVLLGAAAILGAITMQPLAIGHRKRVEHRASVPLDQLEQLEAALRCATRPNAS